MAPAVLRTMTRCEWLWVWVVVSWRLPVPPLQRELADAFVSSVTLSCALVISYPLTCLSLLITGSQSRDAFHCLFSAPTVDTLCHKPSCCPGWGTEAGAPQTLPVTTAHRLVCPSQQQTTFQQLCGSVWAMERGTDDSVLASLLLPPAWWSTLAISPSASRWPPEGAPAVPSSSSPSVWLSSASFASLVSVGASRDRQVTVIVTVCE